MSDTPHQDCTSPFHWGELSAERSHGSLLRYLEAFSEQGPVPAANDVPHIQGVGKIGVRCHNDDPEYYERHWGWKRCSIQSQRNQGVVQNYRRTSGVRDYDF